MCVRALGYASTQSDRIKCETNDVAVGPEIASTRHSCMKIVPIGRRFFLILLLHMWRAASKSENGENNKRP